MDNKKTRILNSLKDELGRLFIISFGVFLFILFFQPFPLEMLDYNNRLLYVTGFGGIAFILACIILVVLPLLLPKWFKISIWESGPTFILNLLLLAFDATAFAFYIRYVGNVPLTFYIMFKVVLVCLLPIIILTILYKNKSMELIIATLEEQNKNYFSQIKKYEKTEGDEKIDLISENKSDRLSLKYKNIVSIKSADNYTQVYYIENEKIEKKLIRNTLKNIESQLANQKHFIRCHRTSIVNIMHIDKMERRYSGYILKIRHLKEDIPVSRQYIMNMKEAISVS